MNKTTEVENVQRIALRPAEAARALGISERKLWSLTADRTTGVPHFRIGRSVRYPAHELTAWASEQAQRNGSKSP